MESLNKFCLKWNEFDTKIGTAFREIRDDKDLLDCTLSCGPQQIQAHKLILSVSSPFFRAVFKQNPHTHPLLYLKGISYTDLQAIITFMYQGEVNIAQEDLNNFLLVAEELKVKGLTQSSSEQEQGHSSDVPSHHSDEASPRGPSLSKSSRERGQEQLEDKDEIQRVAAEIKIEPGLIIEEFHGTGEPELAGIHDDSYEYGDLGEETSVMDTAEPDPLITAKKDKDMEEIIMQMVVQVDGGFKCGSCGKFFTQPHNLKSHIEARHIESSGLPCNICGGIYKTRDSLRKHKKCKHPEIHGPRPRC